MSEASTTSRSSPQTMPAPDAARPTSGSIAEWYERLLDAILQVALVLGGGMAILGSLAAWRAGEPRQMLFYGLVIGLMALITFSHAVEYFIRAGVFLLFLYILGFLSQTRYFGGIGGNGQLAFLTFSVLSAVLLGRRVGFMALALSVGTTLVFAVLYASGLVPPPPHLESNVTLLAWLTVPLQLFVFGTGIIVPVSYLLESFRAAFVESERARVELEAHRRHLRHMVEERTAHLERRTRELQVAAEVARDAALAMNLDDLLEQAVNLIRDHFGFYHAGLFLVDERGEYAVLRAATGEAGRKMLAEHHRLKVGEIGIVGYVTATGEPRIALDVGADAVHFKNPLLPRTRSELALPLKVGDRVIGALDVQSEHPEAFDDEDVAIFQVMADQLAVAIERTRLFEQMRAVLERRLETVISNTPIVLFTVEADGTISLARGKGLERLGWRRARLVGHPVEEVFAETPALVAAFRRALEGESFGALMELSGRFFEWSFTPLVGDDDTVGQVLAVAMDVTELKAAEVALHRRNKLLTALHKTSVEIMGHLKMEDLLRAIVTRAAELVETAHGYVTLVEPDGSTLVTRVGVGIFAHRIGDRLEPGQGVAGRVWLERRTVTLDDYQRVPNRVRGPDIDRVRSIVGVPLLAGEGLGGVIGLARTEVRPFTPEEVETLEQFASLAAIAIENARLFQEVQQTAERLREVDRLKSEFLMHVSHELRSPLSSIIGYAEFLLMGQQFDEETRQDLEAILQNGQRLLHMINDLLDLAKIEAGQLTVNIEPLSVEEVIQEVRRTNEGLFRRGRKPVDFVVIVEEPIPTIYADRVRLNQVLTNLISNAHKFTEEGTVTLRVYQSDHHVCLEVRDTGVGIPPDALEHIFERFQQAHHTGGREGAGLGLPIVKHLVELHGGTIEVQSEVGKGSVFTVRLPLVPHAEARPRPQSAV